mmetsp:Transcript_7936/g.12585  ORF Transcript_7936/g.12585 Transcript_7936/m.12585 type:complete len:153 (-) Transcript_7936:125-583(-)
MTLKTTDLSMVPAGPAISKSKTKPPNSNRGDNKSSRISKSTKMALMAETNQKSSAGEQQEATRMKGPAMRMDSNTVDVRGCNLEDARDKVKDKISKCIMSGHNTVYILHGHGSGGVLKSKLRSWLKSEKQLIKSWKPADASDGGDAFTCLLL